MIEVTGKHNSAKIFTDNVEQTAMGQIIELCNQEFTTGSKIRIMPDTHAGAGCTIGTTMTIHDKVVASMVGVDIGCGMRVAELNVSKDQINFDQLDEIVRKYVPNGFGIHGKEHPQSKLVQFDKVRAPINIDRAKKSIGTLGGGNHFIELNETPDGTVYIVIHSGSRNLGKQVAEHYQKRAYDELMETANKKRVLVEQLKKEGRESEIQAAIEAVRAPKIDKKLAYLQGQGFDDYMNDMRIAQYYAELNRYAMVTEIVHRMGWEVRYSFTTIHNYIDTDNMILRKGAISAQKGELVIVPINMRDGSILAYGKGNPDWNYSGPHGAGRIMSRSKAKQNVDIVAFKETMKDVWTTSVNESTLDESPFAYKDINEILNNVGESLEIAEVIKPIYNFKAN